MNHINNRGDLVSNTKRLSEELIYQQVLKLPCIAENLAKYRGNPAIFYQLIPHDKDKGWNSAKMFPRISYTIDWQYNPERKSDGSMQLDIYCTNETEITPEEIAKEIEDNLSELFLTDKSGTYCLIWNRSDSFGMEGTEPIVFGITVYFDVIQFPNQEQFSQPVWAMNQFIKEMQPNCILLQHEALPAVMKATAKNPIVYVKKLDRKTVKETYAMSCLEEKLSISVISSNEKETGLWIEAITRDLHDKGETIMKNSSPFLLENINEQMENDSLRTGKITVSGQYGVMKKQKEETKLNNITLN